MKIKNSEELLNTGVMGETNVWMREIAVQIARLNETIAGINEGIRLLVPPADEDEQPELYAEPKQTDADIEEQVKRHDEIMAQPISDPEKFTRCNICEKEVPRNPMMAVGESTICYDCIPF